MPEWLVIIDTENNEGRRHKGKRHKGKNGKKKFVEFRWASRG